ncbi:MAG: hypothetical protein ACREB2_02935 [Pseudolabrys sp.]
MRFAPLMLVVVSLVLQGCAADKVDCSLGVGFNGCKPGTKEYELMMENQRDAKALTEIDDNLCRSYGAQPGSQAYAACRRKATSDREVFGPTRAPNK